MIKYVNWFKHTKLDKVLSIWHTLAVANYYHNGASLLASGFQYSKDELSTEDKITLRIIESYLDFKVHGEPFTGSMKSALHLKSFQFVDSRDASLPVVTSAFLTFLSPFSSFLFFSLSPLGGGGVERGGGRAGAGGVETGVSRPGVSAGYHAYPWREGRRDSQTAGVCMCLF